MTYRIVEVCVFRRPYYLGYNPHKLAIITQQTFELGEGIPKNEKTLGWKEVYVNDNTTDYLRDLLIMYGWRVADKRV